MSGLTSVFIILYYIISLSYILYLYGRYKICPELMWCALQLMMFFGVTHFIENGIESDAQLIRLYLLGLIIFVLTSGVLRAINPPRKKIKIEKNIKNYKSRRIYLYTMMLVCITVSAMFFVRGGGNVFLNGLRAMISGAEYSTKYSRMGLLSVSGVGYIYQLRVIVLPLCVLYYIIINKKKATSFILTFVMLVILLGTGQRGGLVSFVAIALVTIYYWSSPRREKTEKKPVNRFRLYFGIITIAGVLFALSTVLNGRVSAGGSVFSAIIKRFLEDNQSCAVMGFRYIKSQEIQYGKDWIAQLRDVLPGKNSYLSMATRIFAYMHGGSLAGTSPACIWGSGYYNFGVFGVIIVAILDAIIINSIHTFFSRRICDEVDIIAYSGLQFLAAFWVADGPVNLFNNGFVTVLLFYWIMKIALRYHIVIGKKRL